MRTIRRVSLGSAIKVGAMLYVLLFLVIGFFAILLPGLLGASFLGALMGDQEGGLMFGAGALVSVIAYVAGLLFAAIGGGLVGFLNALLYNIVAALVGGLEVELS